MDCRIAIKNSNITNNIKETITDKLNILDSYNIRKVNVVCNEDKKGVNIKLSFDYNKKLIKVEKHGDNIDTTINCSIDTAIKQIEKIESKNKSKKNKKIIELDFDLDGFQKTLISFKNNLTCYEKSLKHISNNNSSNEFDKREKLSFENACIQLELLGYDLFYFKDEMTNEDKVVYKNDDDYILSKIDI